MVFVPFWKSIRLAKINIATVAEIPMHSYTSSAYNSNIYLIVYHENIQPEWMVFFFLMGHLSDVYICYTIQSIDEMFISMMCVRCVCVCLFWWECFLPVESEREMNKTNIYGNHFITTTQIYSSSNIIFDFSFGHNQIITKYHFNIPLNFRPLDSVRQHSAFSKMYVYCLLMFSYKKVRIPLSIVTSSLRLGFSSSMFVSVSISTSYQSIPTFNIWFDL